MATDMIDDVLVNLRMISNIGPLQKVSLHTDSRVTIDISSNLWTSIKRWWKGDSRERTVLFIKNVIHSAEDVTTHIMKTLRFSELQQNTSVSKELEAQTKKDREILMLFYDELKGSLVGLENLKKTYMDDVHICSKIEILIKNLNNHIQRIETHIHIFSST